MKYKIIYVITIFAIGATCGKLIDWGYFELKKDISIIEALTLFATIGLGLYITRILEKEVQDNRVRKDLYIAKLAEIENLLSNLEDFVEVDSLYSKILNKIHICGVKRNSIIKVIQSNSLIKKNELDNYDKNIRKRIRRLRNLLTKVDSNNVIVNASGSVTYSESRIREIHTESHLLKDDILEFKTAINFL